VRTPFLGRKGLGPKERSVLKERATKKRGGRDFRGEVRRRQGEEGTLPRLKRDNPLKVRKDTPSKEKSREKKAEKSVDVVRAN